jgi:two-component system, NarL family, sensor kinase
MSLGQIEHMSENGNASLGEKIREAQDLLQRVTQDIRTTSYLLHPPLLDESGIAAALGWYIDGLQQRTPLKIALTISEDFGRLPRDIEIALFRIVQESLTNVLRHSGSDMAAIRIARVDGNVTLQVQDRGKGISARKLAEINRAGSGVGIRGMRDRVRHLKGEIKVDSTESGTTVSISLPIDGWNSQISADADSENLTAPVRLS